MLLFAVLGSCFSVMLGLLLGSFFQTTGSAGAAAGMLSLIYILPIFFVGTFAQLFGTNPFTSIVKVLPTYYIADGVVNAIQNQSTPSNTLPDVSVVLGSTVLLFLISSWLLRRQAAVASTI